MSTSASKAGRPFPEDSKASPRSRLAGDPPKLAITMGDARGIGPEVLLKAIAHPSLKGEFEPVIIGVREVIRAEAAYLWPDKAMIPQEVRKALDSLVAVREAEDDLPPGGSGKMLKQFLYENPATCGLWAGRAIEEAVKLVMSRRAEALVTAPLDKSALNLGGYRYPGHTEMLAHLAGDVKVSMMLVAGALRIVPATTHVALSRVHSLFTVELLLEQARIVHQGLLHLFGIASPSIAFSGLNPHLGDSGLAGDEDRKITAVAVEMARGEGIDARGPFPADTVFVRAVRGEFDAVIAAYHDQAMVAVKMHAFGRGVNITLGLPFIRTSPDHGTALDIAGKGLADPTSMVEAVKLAASLARIRRPGGKE